MIELLHTSNIMPAKIQGSGFSNSLAITNQISELVRVASWLEQLARHCQLGVKTVFKLDLVLNEALPNIISYAYPDQLSHEILIRLEDRGDHLLLEIIDDGVAFNPLAVNTPAGQLTLETAPVTGRGILLIRSFTDTQEYERIDNTNTLRVTIQKTSESCKHPPDDAPDEKCQ